MTPARPEKKLAEVQGASADVAAHEIGILFFQIGWRKNSASEHTIAKTRGKALYLAL
jgi:hypothetical protein